MKSSFYAEQEGAFFKQVIEDIDWIYDDIMMLIDSHIDFELLETLDRIERLRNAFVFKE